MIKCRLLLLANRTSKIGETQLLKRKRRFDLTSWVSREPCGTSACAVGEATFMKRFRELGLRVRQGDLFFKGRWGWAAVEKLFDINTEEAMSLFSYNGYPGNPGAGEVANKIRAFVKAGEPA